MTLFVFSLKWNNYQSNNSRMKLNSCNHNELYFINFYSPQHSRIIKRNFQVKWRWETHYSVVWPCYIYYYACSTMGTNSGKSEEYFRIFWRNYAPSFFNIEHCHWCLITLMLEDSSVLTCLRHVKPFLINPLKTSDNNVSQEVVRRYSGSINQ